jgi:hypothetical protein
MNLSPLQHAALLALASALVGCGGPDSQVKVDVHIEKDLRSDIRVIKTQSKKPGVVNPVEVSVKLENTGTRDHRILFDGRWRDNAGNGYGGITDLKVIRAGSSIECEAGTRSKGATKLAVNISSTSLNADQLVALKMSQAKPAVAGHGIAYTATPTLDQIPKWIPKGVANGAPFVAGTILFSPINGVWEMQIIDREIDPFKGIAYARSMDGNAGLQVIHLNLPDQPATGKVFDRKLAYGGGYFQIQTSPGSTNTTSWNTKIAWVLEITDWNRRAYNKTGGTFQHGGTVSGRLYVCFKGYPDKIKDSFVAGVFENAPLVYYGDPRGM